MTSLPTPTKTSRLDANGGRRLLCRMEDYHEFVVSEREAVEACWRAEMKKVDQAELADQFELMGLRISAWCRSEPQVQSCFLYPRRDDMLVLVSAKTEDEDGALHGRMTDLELALDDAKTPFRLCFLLLRRQEASGMKAFANPDKSWQIHADGT
jgi:hypothetical protein